MPTPVRESERPGANAPGLFSLCYARPHAAGRGRSPNRSPIPNEDSSIITSPAEIDHLARLLRNVAPGVGAIGSLQPVTDGYSATILRASSGIAVRVPKSEAAGERQLRTISPQRRLARLLPAPVPLPLWALPMGDPFPFGIAGYSWLDGEPLAADGGDPAIAERVGTFLATLHGLDTTSFRRALPGRSEVESGRDRIVETAATWLHDTERPETMDRLAAWWDTCRAALTTASYTPSLVHGDLWYGNLLVRDGSRLSGILDWENLAVADPAQDFATLMHSGEEFTQAVMDAYERAGGILDQALLDRGLWHWEFRELTGIALAIDAGDPVEARDAARKLRAGPLSRLFVPEQSSP